MLEDLSEAADLVRERVSRIDVSQAFIPSPDLWAEISQRYRDFAATSALGIGSDQVTVVNNAMVITTPSPRFLTISAQELPRCWAVFPFIRAVSPYMRKLDELSSVLGFESRQSARGEEVFKNLREDWNKKMPAGYPAAIESAVSTKLGLTEVEKERFTKFLTDKNWSNVNKTLERPDWLAAAVATVGGWLAQASERRGALSIALERSVEFESVVEQFIAGEDPDRTDVDSSVGQSDVVGCNVIFYGAPGTGKSYLVNELVANGAVIRTVFHPDTQHSDFFGSLKPSMRGHDVVYGFAPGPLAVAFAAALRNPKDLVYLVIEELNRAPAAAVFGELFQLLDRDESGRGNYAVDFPNPESRDWFCTTVGMEIEHLRMPANLTIFATMNSSDQGVYPLDTAFRRRWDQSYLPLYAANGPTGSVAVRTEFDDEIWVPWRVFIKILNGWVVDKLEIQEDRLLGPWFVTDGELGGPIPQKVLLYLWDDILRHHGRSVVFDSKFKTYGGLDHAWRAGTPILSKDLIDILSTQIVDSELDMAAEDEDSEYES